MPKYRIYYSLLHMTFQVYLLCKISPASLNLITYFIHESVLTERTNKTDMAQYSTETLIMPPSLALNYINSRNLSLKKLFYILWYNHSCLFRVNILVLLVYFVESICVPSHLSSLQNSSSIFVYVRILVCAESIFVISRCHIPVNVVL